MSFCLCIFFFSSRRRHTTSVSAFLLNRSSDLGIPAEPLRNRLLVLEKWFLENEKTVTQRSEERRVGKECRSRWWPENEKTKKTGRKCTQYKTRTRIGMCIITH